MRYGTLQGLLSRFLRNYVMYFETSIKRTISAFVARLPDWA